MYQFLFLAYSNQTAHMWAVSKNDVPRWRGNSAPSPWHFSQGKIILRRKGRQLQQGKKVTNRVNGEVKKETIKRMKENYKWRGETMKTNWRLLLLFETVDFYLFIYLFTFFCFGLPKVKFLLANPKHKIIWGENWEKWLYPSWKNTSYTAARMCLCTIHIFLINNRKGQKPNLNPNMQ